MKSHYILSAALALAMASPALRAEDLTTEIDVESSVAIELPAATPLSTVNPALLYPAAGSYTLKPTMVNRAVDYTPYGAPSDSSLYSGLSAPDTHRGYLWAGYLPAYNLGVAAGYRLINTSRTTAGVAAGFNGYSYDSPTDIKYNVAGRGGKQTVSDNTFNVQVYTSHHFSRLATLSADLRYMYGDVRYCGELEDGAIHRKINAFEAGINLSGADTATYSLDVRYSHFGFTGAGNADPHTASDDRLQAALGAGVRFGAGGRQHIGLNVALDLLAHHGGIVSITPAYTIRSEKFLLRTGVKVDIGIKSDDKALHLAPDLTMAWMPGDRFAAYTTFTGGEQFRTLRDRYDYSPFATASTTSSRSYTPVNARVGFNIRPVQSFTADIFAGYECTRRMPMLALLADSHTTAFVPVDLSGWTLGAELGYSYEKYLTLSANARLYPSGYSAGSAEAPDRARIVLGAKAAVRPIEKLTIDIDYTLRTGRHYYILSPSTESTDGQTVPTRERCDMGNLSELSVGGSYAISDVFSVFLRLENLLCRRTLIVPYVSTQRLHGLAGISLRF